MTDRSAGGRRLPRDHEHTAVRKSLHNNHAVGASAPPSGQTLQLVQRQSLKQLVQRPGTPLRRWHLSVMTAGNRSFVYFSSQKRSVYLTKKTYERQVTEIC